MKSIVNYINEMKGSAFKETVKYTLSDWKEWRKEIGSHKYFEIHKQDDMYLVYLDKKSGLEHVASYNPGKEILYCDDIKLFGNEK